MESTKDKNKEYLERLGYNEQEINTILNSTDPEEIVKARRIWEHMPKDKDNERN